MLPKTCIIIILTGRKLCYTNKSDLNEQLASCEEYMLPKETARQIIGEVLNAVKEWRALATRLGLVKSEQERFVAVLERANTIL